MSTAKWHQRGGCLPVLTSTSLFQSIKLQSFQQNSCLDQPSDAISLATSLPGYLATVVFKTSVTQLLRHEHASVPSDINHIVLLINRTITVIAVFAYVTDHTSDLIFHYCCPHTCIWLYSWPCQWPLCLYYLLMCYSAYQWLLYMYLLVLLTIPMILLMPCTWLYFLESVTVPVSHSF